MKMKTSMKTILFFLVVLMNWSTIASAANIKVLAVVDKSRESEIQGLRDASEVINQDPSILGGHTFSLSVIPTTDNDTFEAIDDVCSQILDGVEVLMDLTSPLVSLAMTSLSKNMTMPHVTVVTDSYNNMNSGSVRVKATNYAMINIVRNIVSWENLTNVGIFYDETFDLDTETKNLLQNVPAQHTYIRMAKTIAAIRDQLNSIMDYELNHLFLLGTAHAAEQYLSEASFKDMISFRYTWYILTQNVEVPCDMCRHGSSYLTLTAVPHSGVAAQYVNQINAMHQNGTFTEGDITVSEATAYDLMFHVAKTLHDMSDSQIDIVAPPRNCSVQTPADPTMRTQFKDTFQQVTHRGIFANRLTWDRDIGVFDVTMNVDALTVNDSTIITEQLGNWTLSNGLWLQNDRVKIPHVPSVYRIITIEGPPFVFVATEKPPGVDYAYYNETSGKYYWGYCIDLIIEIQKKMKFDFTLYESPDGAYGGIQPNGTWNGLVNELIQNRADIVVAPLSVMAERENVIDFTVPYYDLVGISILMKKPQIPYSVFRFMSVLEEPVWGCIFSAFIIVSIMLAVFDKFSPYSYQNNRHVWDGEGEEPRVFTLKEGLWFCMTSLTPQGGGEAPRALSGRLLAATWWMFGFIIIATYTANLAAFLTVSRLETPIESLDDLAKQFKTKYAPEKSTATETYFRRMADIEEMFYHIWKDMSLNDSMDQVERAKLAVWDYPVSDKFTNMWVSMQDSGLPDDFEIALDWVKNNKKGEEFAFLGDATRNKYAMLTDCDLWEVGEEFSRKPYALAVQEGSPLKNQLSSVILQLLNQRILEDLKTRWWEYNKVTCEKMESESDGISIRNIGGVFIVIFIGIGLGLLTLAFEYYWYRWRPQANNNAGGEGQVQGKSRPQQGHENQAFTPNT